jgi:hypothetical protein
VDVMTDKIVPCAETDEIRAEPAEESGPQSGSNKIELYPGHFHTGLVLFSEKHS